MNLTKIKPLTIIGGILGAILFIVIIFLLFTNKKPQQPQSYQPSIPPRSTQKGLPQAENFQEELAKIQDILPYKTANYSIEYLKPANIVNIKLNGSSEERLLESKREAEAFIKEKGITDLCTLNIFWIPQVSQQLRQTLSAKNFTTTGCKR